MAAGRGVGGPEHTARSFASLRGAAKQYLSQLRATVDEEDFGRARGVTGDSDGEEGDEEEDEADPDRSRRARSAQQDATTSGRDRLTQLLQVDAAQVRLLLRQHWDGVVARRRPCQGSRPHQDLCSTPPQAAGRVQRTLAQHVVIPDLSAAGGAARRGHRLPATALALAPDDSQCWTVSKDGSIVCWDLERGTKTHLHRGPTQGVFAGAPQPHPGCAVPASAQRPQAHPLPAPRRSLPLVLRACMQARRRTRAALAPSGSTRARGRRGAAR